MTDFEVTEEGPVVRNVLTNNGGFVLPRGERQIFKQILAKSDEFMRKHRQHLLLAFPLLPPPFPTPADCVRPNRALLKLAMKPIYLNPPRSLRG